MRLPLLSLLLLCPACWVGSDEVASKVNDVPDTDVDTDSDTEPWDELVLTSVEPTVGINKGGLQVTIVAGPLDPDQVPEVTFGGVPAEVLSHTGEQIVVRSPAVGVEGAVDVVVDSADRTARASGIFYYWADGSGRTGLLGTVSNYDFDRGYDLSSYFGGVPEDYTSEMNSAAVIYIEPADIDYWRLYSDALDTCTRNYRYDGPAINILKPGVTDITLGEGGSAVTFQPDEQGEYYGLGMGDGWLPTAQDLSLSQGQGDPGWIPFTAPDAVRMPSPGFRVTSPAADFSVGTVDPSFDLRWEGGNPGEVVIVQLYRYSFSGSFEDDVTCALVDDGLHRINSSVWSNPEPIGGTVTMQVGRVELQDAILPTNGARVGIYGVHWWYGAANFRLF